MFINYVPNIPNPTRPTAFPSMLVGAILPMLMVEDFRAASKDEIRQWILQRFHVALEEDCHDII